MFQFFRDLISTCQKVRGNYRWWCNAISHIQSMKTQKKSSMCFFISPWQYSKKFNYIVDFSFKPQGCNFRLLKWALWWFIVNLLPFFNRRKDLLSFTNYARCVNINLSCIQDSSTLVLPPPDRIITGLYYVAINYAVRHIFINFSFLNCY